MRLIGLFEFYWTKQVTKFKVRLSTIEKVRHYDPSQNSMQLWAALCIRRGTRKRSFAVTVACPVCGLDGTTAANEIAAMALASPPAVASLGGLRVQSMAPSAGVSTSPLLTNRTTTTATLSPSVRPQPKPSIPSPASRGRDGWASDETQFNKLGTYVVMGPAIIAALLSWGVFGIAVPGLILCIVVGICGVIGGIMNLMGRGPVAAGAVIGLVMGLGGYAAVFWWIHERQKVHGFEVTIAFIVGAAPGFLLQFILQKIMRKRTNVS